MTSVRSVVPEAFKANPARGRFNSAFFSVMGGYINWHMRKRKAKAFADPVFRALPHARKNGDRCVQALQLRPRSIVFFPQLPKCAFKIRHFSSRSPNNCS